MKRLTILLIAGACLCALVLLLTDSGNQPASSSHATRVRPTATAIDAGLQPPSDHVVVARSQGTARRVLQLIGPDGETWTKGLVKLWHSPEFQPKQLPDHHGAIELAPAARCVIELTGDDSPTQWFLLNSSSPNLLRVSTGFDLRLELSDDDARSLPIDRLHLFPDEKMGAGIGPAEFEESWRGVAAFFERSRRRLLRVLETGQAPEPLPRIEGSIREAAWSGLEDLWKQDDATGKNEIVGRLLNPAPPTRFGDEILWSGVPSGSTWRLGTSATAEARFSNAPSERSRRHPPGLSLSGQLKAGEGEEVRVGLKFPSPTGIMGWIQPSDGTRMRDARVRLHEEDGNSTRTYGETSVSAPDYAFLFEGIDAGSYCVTCSWWESETDLYISSRRITVGKGELVDCGPLAPALGSTDIDLRYRLESHDKPLSSLLGDHELENSFPLLDIWYLPTLQERRSLSGPRLGDLIPIRHSDHVRVHGMWNGKWRMGLASYKLRLQPGLKAETPLPTDFEIEGDQRIELVLPIEDLRDE